MSINLNILIKYSCEDVEQISFPKCCSRQLAKDVGYNLDAESEITVLRDASPIIAQAILTCLEFNYTGNEFHVQDLLDRATVSIKDSKSVTIGWW